MGITAITAQQTSGLEWVMEASSDLTDAMFYWYVGGILSYTSPIGRITLRLAAEEVQTVEVFDSASDSPAESYAGRATLQWDKWPLCDSWVVEQYVDSAWVQVSAVGGGNSSVATYQGAFLADESTHQFRVVPISSGNRGTSREFSLPIIRKPNRLTVSSFAYNVGTGALTAVVV